MSRRVLVLGGGIIGLACAFEAAQRGIQVTVVEPGNPGGQASGAAAGMLAPFSENTDRPDPFFLLCLESLRRYPEWVRRVEEAAGPGVKLEWSPSGSLNLAFHEADLAPLRTRMEWQNRYGAAAELVDGASLGRLEPKLAAGAAGAVYYPGESHVFAPGLVAALETACRNAGVKIAARTGELTDLRLPGGRTVAVDTAAGGTFGGDQAIVCAGAWSGSYEKWLGIRIPVHPIRGQICAYASEAGEVRHMVFTPQAYWAAKGNGTLVCGASEDVAGFDTSVTERGIGRLQRCSVRTLPYLADRPLLSRWAGLRPATADGRPLLGVVPGAPQVIFASGHYRNGILLAPVTAAAACGLLDGRADAEAARVKLNTFAPGRFTADAPPASGDYRVPGRRATV